MKLKIISDQHGEFRRDARWQKYLDFHHTGEPADACIMAGDFDTVRGDTVKKFQDVCSREKQVIYVPGNHDYYSGSPVNNIDLALAEIEAVIPNLRVLRSGRPFLFEGRRFLGDTMWIRSSPKLDETKELISDPWSIAEFWRDILPKNTAFQQYLADQLQAGDIVVTHHLPSTISTPKFFLNSPLQPWFVCSQEQLIKDREPTLWVHGHTHSFCDYHIFKTRVVCNPAGYPPKDPAEHDDLRRCLIEI